jgi:hypothetical protein
MIISKKSNSVIRMESMTGFMYLTEHEIGEIVIWAKDHMPEMITEIFSER